MSKTTTNWACPWCGITLNSSNADEHRCQEQLAALAEFCGAESNSLCKDRRTGKPYWQFPSGKTIAKHLWNPYEDWNHLRLVLEAWCKKVHSQSAVLNTLAIKAMYAKSRGEDFDFASAVCVAALEVIAKSRNKENQSHEQRSS